MTYAKDLTSIPSGYNSTGVTTSSYSARFGAAGHSRGAVHYAPLRSQYDVLAGADLYGTTFNNARSAFAPGGSCLAAFIGTIGHVVCSSAGAFTSSYNPANPVNLVPRNYLIMSVRSRADEEEAAEDSTGVGRRNVDGTAGWGPRSVTGQHLGSASA